MTLREKPLMKIIYQTFQSLMYILEQLIKWIEKGYFEDVISVLGIVTDNMLEKVFSYWLCWEWFRKNYNHQFRV